MSLNCYEIEFYEDVKGVSPTFSFIESLREKSIKGDQLSQSLLKAIYHKFKLLEINGTRDGMPDFRYMHSKKYSLWEIRIKHPTGYYRIFICQCPWQKNKFVILNYFIKDEKKTPSSEISKAEKLMDDYIKRNKPK